MTCESVEAFLCCNNFWQPVFSNSEPIKKNLSLEPLLKLARFIDGIINLKFEKLPAAAVFAAAKKGVQKWRKFS